MIIASLFGFHVSFCYICVLSVPQLVQMGNAEIYPWSCAGVDIKHKSSYVLHRRKLQTPGTAEAHKRQAAPTINQNNRQPAHLTDQAPGSIEILL